MSSIIGVSLIGVGSLCAGLLAVRQLGERVKLLHAFSMLLERLAGEIGFRLTPVTMLSARLDNAALHGFWRYIDEHYSPLGERSYADVWRDAARQMDLSELDRELIGELGSILGQYDPERQTRSLELVRRQLEVSLQMARDKQRKQARMYGMTGLLCGLLAVVLFL